MPSEGAEVGACPTHGGLGMLRWARATKYGRITRNITRSRRQELITRHQRHRHQRQCWVSILRGHCLRYVLKWSLRYVPQQKSLLADWEEERQPENILNIFLLSPKGVNTGEKIRGYLGVVCIGWGGGVAGLYGVGVFCLNNLFWELTFSSCYYLCLSNC